MGLLDSLKERWNKWWNGEGIPNLAGPIIFEPDSTSASSTSSKHVSSTPSLPEEREPWFVMRCGVCDNDVPLYIDINVNQLNPFNSTVLTTQCEQCAARIAVVIPPVQIMDADTLTLREADLIHNGYTD